MDPGNRVILYKWSCPGERAFPAELTAKGTVGETAKPGVNEWLPVFSTEISKVDELSIPMMLTDEVLMAETFMLSRYWWVGTGTKVRIAARTITAKMAFLFSGIGDLEFRGSGLWYPVMSTATGRMIRKVRNSPTRTSPMVISNW